ncbi:MAG: hypothetical protein HQL69_21550 [Magnetococcales bacterium]|nr:hypothetical protein [Magnetococcales bacterium]
MTQEELIKALEARLTEVETRLQEAEKKLEEYERLDTRVGVLEYIGEMAGSWPA